MMSEVDHLSVFLSQFAINMFTLVAVHLFPLYFPGNKLKHPSECTLLKVIFLSTYALYKTNKNKGHSSFPCSR